MIFSRIKEYKDLFLILIWREFHIRYKNSVLGVSWALLQPLSLMCLFTAIFTFVVPIKISSQPFPLFFYCGLVFWNFFTSALNYAIPCLNNNYNLITKVKFPKELLPFSGVVVAFIDMLIACVLLVIFMIFYKVHFTMAVLWVIPLLFLLFVFTTSMALIFAALNALYKDVGLVSSFIIQAWFFATPIMYSFNHASPVIRKIMFLNPLTFIIENMRICLLEARGITAWQVWLMFLLMLILFIMTYKFFICIERKFADVI